MIINDKFGRCCPSISLGKFFAYLTKLFQVQRFYVFELYEMIIGRDSNRAPSYITLTCNRSETSIKTANCRWDLLHVRR